MYRGAADQIYEKRDNDFQYEVEANLGSAGWANLESRVQANLESLVQSRSMQKEQKATWTRKGYGRPISAIAR